MVRDDAVPAPAGGDGISRLMRTWRQAPRGCTNTARELLLSSSPGARAAEGVKHTSTARCEEAGFLTVEFVVCDLANANDRPIRWVGLLKYVIQLRCLLLALCCPKLNEEQQEERYLLVVLSQETHHNIVFIVLMTENQASRQVTFIRRGEPRPGVPSGTTHIVVEHESVRIIPVRAFEWGIIPVRAFNRSHERAIQKWIRSVLREIARYKTKHRRLLNEAARTLELNSLPTDIVFKMSSLFSSCRRSLLMGRIK
eukprot:scaffold14525_cov79-Skeletonema_marinoi.AAC.1